MSCRHTAGEFDWPSILLECFLVRLDRLYFYPTDFIFTDHFASKGWLPRTQRIVMYCPWP